MIKRLVQFWLVKEQRAVSSAFLTFAIAFGAWITRLPELQQRLEISDGQLGTALFCLPLGAVSLLPFFSKIISALTERVALLLAITFLLLGFVLPSLISDLSGLMLSLYLIGLSIGLTDVSMNAIAAELEKQRKIQIMATCHGFFSVGGIIGALVSSVFIVFGSGLLLQSIVVSAGLLILMYAQFPYLINAVQKDIQKGFTLPPPEVIGLALIGLCTMMTEGGIMDWSTIYIERDLGALGRWSGLGFAGFSFTMALGRFKGDAFIARYANAKLIRVGLLFGIAGLLVAQIPYPITAIIGFTIAGLGLSIIIPIVFSKAAKVKGVSSAKGLSSVASAGYIGWLAGPVMMGYLSEWLGLQSGFLFLVLLCLLALVFTTRLK